MAGYEVLIYGLALFMLMHISTGIYEVRQKMLSLLGLALFRIIHSAASLVGLYLIVEGYSANPKEDLYVLGNWALKAPIYIMPIALIFIVGSSSNSDVVRITRHPMLWAIVLWSATHLLANGDKASVILFGSFLIYSLLAMKLSDDKKAKSDPTAWEKMKNSTSIIPFVAMIEGKAGKARGDHGLRAIIGGLFLYSLLLWFHSYFTGVSLIKL